MGEAGERYGRSNDGKNYAAGKSGVGFSYHLKQTRTRPNNSSIRDLLTDERYTKAVLKFQRSTEAGMVKGGASEGPEYM